MYRKSSMYRYINILHYFFNRRYLKILQMSNHMLKVKSVVVYPLVYYRINYASVRRLDLNKSVWNFRYRQKHIG